MERIGRANIIFDREPLSPYCHLRIRIGPLVKSPPQTLGGGSWVVLVIFEYVFCVHLGSQSLLCAQCAAFACLGHPWTDFKAQCNKT